MLFVHSIAATITAPGAAAVSITRISGDNSWAIASSILKQPKLEANRFSLSWLIDAGRKLDHVLVLAFKAPHSYTGEDVIEIHSHGGPYITRRILQIILDAGAKLAKPGEFTERAFLNHKLDLSQAESVLDLIEARSSLSSENAVKLYEGALGTAIATMRHDLLELLAGITAGIDFPDEVGDYQVSEFTARITKVLSTIDGLLAGENAGRILREGYRVALVGAPNAGKSSLLNTLLEDERAIVTDIPGTTRDIIEETISINGLPVVLVDTAGIRDTSDLVERLGVERSQQAIKDADLVILLEDISCHPERNSLRHCEVRSDEAIHLLSKELAITETIPASKLIKVGTKLDLVMDRHAATRLAMTDTSHCEEQSDEAIHHDLCISSTNKTNIDKLKQLIYDRVLSGSGADIKINERQADLLRQARHHLEHALASTSQPQDFWTIDLKSAIESLGQITGAVLTEELLDDIFSRFCIGK